MKFKFLTISQFVSYKLVPRIFVGSFLMRGNRRRSFLDYCDLEYKIKLSSMVPFNEFVSYFIMNLRPLVSLRSKKFGGLTRKIPCFITEKRSLSVALHWLVTSMKKMNVRKVDKNLYYSEIIPGQFKSFKLRSEYYHLALSNRPFLGRF